MDVTPKTPWKERRLKEGSILDRKLSADILRIRRIHDIKIRENEKSVEHNAFVFAVCILTALVLLVAFGGKAHAEPLNTSDINLDIIADIESSHNPMAVNGNHIGEFQISQSVVDDLNKHGAGISLNEMFIPLFAHDAAMVYINRIIPSYLDKYGIPDTTINRIIAWNWGIDHLRKWFKHGSHWNQLPYETRHYIRKYYRELKGDD